VLRIALFALFHAAFLGVTVLVDPASGQVPARPGTISEIPLPGGVRAAADAIGDLATPDRAQFLAEFIRRTYDTPLGAKADAREPVIRSLVAALAAGKPPADTIPLPLSTKFWTDVVFRKQATPDTLVASIIQSRNAALLYLGLLSLDDDSRAWMAEQPSLISDLVMRRAAALVTAAPGLHITSAGIQVPGGPAAEPVWQALVGHRPSETTEFVRSIVSSDEGRLAYFFGAMGVLSASQVRLAMMLDLTDVNRRVDAGRRMYAVFQRLWLGKALDQRVFARPTFDPALLMFQLTSNPNGDLALPGTRGFWTVALTDTRDSHAKSAREDAPPTIAWDQPPDFPWLCEQIFKGDLIEHRRHFMMVLFAARHAARITKETARDALEAVRASGTYPALSATLERAGITDLSVFAAAARRAAALMAIEDETRATRAIVQYQGALAMITRAAARGTLAPDAATKLVTSLSAITTSDRGDYDGRIVSWLGGWLNNDARPGQRPSGPAGDGSADDVYESASGPMEEDALRVLTGRSASASPTLDWEGTRYRVDLPRSEAVRLMQSQGQAARPYLSSAWAVMNVADTLADSGLTREAVQQQAQSLARVWQRDRPEQSEDNILSSYSDASLSLQRAARSGDVPGAARIAPSLRALADELIARGLMEWAYAAALGPRDGLSISAAEAASRHDLGLRSPGGRTSVWRLPIAGNDTSQRWRVLGSLLGLDVVLADFSLVSLTSKPPSRRPSLGEIDRRVFIDTIAVVEPKLLSDSDRDAIAGAIRRGRARLANVRSPVEASEIADTAALGPLRRTLLSWTIAHDAPRAGAFLSTGELFSLGAGDTRFTSLNAWGVVSTSRAGCLCLEVVAGRPTEIFAGRWNTGMAASVFPDLNLRLAELLSDLHMPATLLAPILTSATLDFVNSVTSRDQDDRRGLAEFVEALTLTRVEQYLALLTSDGPLVPLGESPKGKGSESLETAAQVVRQR
jgi:hypothetical protein